MKLESANALNRRWAVILAGGDGKRLLPLTRSIAGDDRPKQFCPVLGTETLLECTQRRVARSIQPRQTLLVLTQGHERFYKTQVRDVLESLRVVQPFNRGTAPAIIYALLRLRRIDLDMAVAFFPADHHFSNGGAFLQAVDRAFETIESQPRLIALLGLAPESAEVDYGWIEPGGPLPKRSRGLNSFIMVGRVETFLRMVASSLPEHLQRFEYARSAFGMAAETETVRRIYEDIAPANFSKEVLAARPKDLVVLRLENAGWSDLGEPARVHAVLGRRDLKAKSSRSEGEIPEAHCASSAVA